MENYVFFWRLKDNNAYLGQWASSPFTTRNGLKFATAEQYMMYYKAVKFNDFKTAGEIYTSINAHPSIHRSLGRKIKNFNDAKWKEVCNDIVFEGNMYKFTQNEHMRKVLVSTGNKILVEASSQDPLWGIGYAAEDALKNIDNWGENRLGKILMRVRNELNRGEIDARYTRPKISLGFVD